MSKLSAPAEKAAAAPIKTLPNINIAKPLRPNDFEVSRKENLTSSEACRGPGPQPRTSKSSSRNSRLGFGALQDSGFLLRGTLSVIEGLQ